MTSKIHEMYVELMKCTQALEEDVKINLEALNNTNGNAIALEKSKDYHYMEILSHLKQIKDHIRILAEHTMSIDVLQKKISGTNIDKNYIKKQVETFQNLGSVHRRELKPVRSRETTSLKFLQRWEQITDENKNDFESSGVVVIKRSDTVRKKKKIVSSTVDGFLDSSGRSISFDSLLDETEEETPHLTFQFSKSVDAVDLTDKPKLDTKPRIVDFIYKKPQAETV